MRIVTGLLAVLLLALVAAIAFDYLNFLRSPINASAESFTIPQGASLTRVANNLESEGIIENAGYLRVYARWNRTEGSIQAGEYRLKADATPVTLLEQFVSGDVRLYPFTIIEGWNHWELINAVGSSDILEPTLTHEDWGPFLDELGADVDDPEGLFLPETYMVPKGSLDRAVLADAYRSMQTALAEEWVERSDEAVVQSPYQALILASIIEKETARVDERARIAGVFSRRLKLGMRLQTDPTVIYGLLPDFNGNLTRRDLRADTPYNTYTRGGLPPTPIAMPGRDAIRAALNPADGTELYFVASGLGDGSHVFSDTLEQHQAAVRDYLKRLRNPDLPVPESEQ